jgi:hypothetical protein
MGRSKREREKSCDVNHENDLNYDDWSGALSLVAAASRFWCVIKTKSGAENICANLCKKKGKGKSFCWARKLHKHDE